MSASFLDSLLQQGHLCLHRTFHYANLATTAVVDHVCPSMPYLHEALERIDLIQANQFSKLIGIYRCALIQFLLKENIENAPYKKISFDALCAKYSGYRLQEVLLTDLFASSQSSSLSSESSTIKVIYVPKIPFMDDFVEFFDQMNFDELFDPNSFCTEPSLVVRIKRIYNIMLKLERFLVWIEENRVGLNLYLLYQQGQEIITDLFHLDIDLLALMMAQMPHLNAVGDAFARLQSLSENGSVFDLIQQFTSNRQVSQFGENCGFWIGLLLSQSHEQYQSLNTITKIGDELNKSVNRMSDACASWAHTLSGNLDLSSSYAEEKIIQTLQLKVKEILSKDAKVADFITQLFSDDFIGAFQEYQKKIVHHLHEFLPSLRMPNLGLLNVGNLSKLHQLISLIKIIYQHVSEFKEHTKTLQDKYNDMFLLLLFHLKYDVMLSIVSYVDVVHNSAFLKSGSVDSGIGPLDSVEILLQYLYGQMISSIGKVCDFSQHQSLEVLFDEHWIAKRQELAIRNSAFLYEEKLKLESKQAHFDYFRKELLSNTRSELLLNMTSEHEFELHKNPVERQRFIQSFVIAYPLIQKYYPEIADRIRAALQNSMNSPLDSIEDMTQIDEDIAQCLEHNLLQQKALTIFLTQLSDLNKSGLFFLELQAERFVNHDDLFAMMKSNYAIFKLDNCYYFLNQSTKKAQLIPSTNYMQLTRVCQKFFHKYGVLFRFKANDCQKILNLFLEQSPHLLEGHQDFSIGIKLVGDVPTLTHFFAQVDKDCSRLSEKEILNAYQSNQAILRQFNFHLNYAEQCCQTLASLSEKVPTIESLEAKDYADLIHVFVTAKPVLKLVYEEIEWTTIVRDIQLRKNIVLANLNKNIAAKLVEILQIKKRLEDTQQKIKAAYQLKIAETEELAKKLKAIVPDQRLGKLIRHDNYSKFISELMQRLKTELYPYFCQDIQEELAFKDGKEAYALEYTPNSVYQLPKQVADLVWGYNSLYNLREFILEMEAATGTMGFTYLQSQKQLIAKFFSFQILFFFCRPSAQPAFNISSNTDSRILQSTWALKEGWQTFYEQLHQLLVINDLEIKGQTSGKTLVEMKRFKHKHQMNTIVHWIYSVPFLITRYIDQNLLTTEQKEFDGLKEKNLQIAKRIDGVLNPSWYFTLLELPNLAKSVLDMYSLVKETLSATKRLTYEEFRLIRAEIYKIYAVIEAAEIDLGVKERVFLQIAEDFLEKFTEELLVAVHLPFENRLSLLSRRDGFEYRKQCLQQELEKLSVDKEHLDQKKEYLIRFLSSSEELQKEMLRHIYPIIEAYRSVQIEPVDLREIRFKTQPKKRLEIIRQDEFFKAQYDSNRTQWGIEDKNPVPKNFEFPNHFLAFIQLVIDNMQGKLETIRISQKIHTSRIKLLEEELVALDDTTTQKKMILKCFKSYKESLLDACVEQFKDFPALQIQYRQILNEAFSEEFWKKLKTQLEMQAFANVENVLKTNMIQQVEDLDKVQRLHFEKKRMILEKIKHFDVYLESLETNFAFIITENTKSIKMKRSVLKLLFQEVLESDDDKLQNFHIRIRECYTLLTTMGQMETWMQELIQSVFWVLECLGLVKSYRHSFFYALHDAAKQALQYEEIKPNISNCLVL